MSHSLLASIWEALQRRNDSANILREILGQHTLDQSDYAISSTGSALEAFRHVYWIKTIFDLQRTYLQAAAGGGHCNVPGLLPTDIVYSTILYLVHLKPKIFPDDQSSFDWPIQRLQLAYTILSGCRLLILLNEKLDRGKLYHLRKSLELRWRESSGLSDCEHFILFELVLEALGSRYEDMMQSGNGYALNLRQMGLPTFSEGLYPLCIRPKRLVSSTFTNIRKGGPMWLTWYWTIFDAVWSSESALIQAHLDQTTHNSNSVALSRSSSSIEIVSQLQNTRSNLLSAIFITSDCDDISPARYILDSLKASIVDWHSEDIERQPSSTKMTPEKHNLELCHALNTFKTWLNERMVQVASLTFCLNCEQSLDQRAPLNIHASERTNSIFFVTGQHTDRTSRSIGIIPNGDSLDTLSSSDGASFVNTATSSSLSSSAPAAIRRPMSPRSEGGLSPSTSVDTHTPKSLSEGTTPTPSSLKEAKIIRGKTFRRVLKVSKDKVQTSLEACRPSSHCFSASGSHIFLWGGNVNGVIMIRVPSGRNTNINEVSKWELNAVKQVASGTNKCVVVASHQERFKLVSFSLEKPQPDAQIDIDIPIRHYTDSCIVMSRDDRFAALAVNDTVQLYRLSGGNIRRILVHEQLHLYQHLATQRRDGKGSAAQALSSREAAQEAQNLSTVVEQRLSFSPSGDRLVVATHLADKNVYIDVYRTDTDPCVAMTATPKSFRMPPWTANDGGLTNVFFNDAAQCSLLTAFISKEYPSLWYFNNEDDDMIMDSSFTSKIVHAAQCSDSSFILANGMTEIIHLTWKSNETINARRLKKCSAKIPSNAFKPGNITLAIPEPQLAFAFWIKDYKLILRKMDIGNADSYIDIDLRTYVDRLQSERVERIILSHNTLAPENAFGEPSLLHNDSAIPPIVELPGSLKPVAELEARPHNMTG